MVRVELRVNFFFCFHDFNDILTECLVHREQQPNYEQTEDTIYSFSFVKNIGGDNKHKFLRKKLIDYNLNRNNSKSGCCCFRNSVFDGKIHLRCA